MSSLVSINALYKNSPLPRADVLPSSRRQRGVELESWPLEILLQKVQIGEKIPAN